MARIIGLAVHDDKVFITPIENIILSILLLPGIYTQKTALWLFHPDELHSPRCPDVFHDTLLIHSLGVILIGAPLYVNEMADNLQANGIIASIR